MFNSGNKANKTKQTRAMTLNIKTYATLKNRQRIDRDKLHNRVLDRALRQLTEMHNYTISTRIPLT